MSSIVNCKAEANYEVNHDDIVHRKVPEVDQPKEEQIDKDDSKDDQERDWQATCDEHDDKEYSTDGQTDTDGCFLEEHDILLKPDRRRRVKVGITNAVGVNDAANVF